MSGSKLGPVSFQIPGMVTEDFQLDSKFYRYLFNFNAFHVSIVPEENSMLVDSQQQDVNLVTLERNSFNFLE